MSIQRVMLASHSMSLAFLWFINGGVGGGEGGCSVGGNKEISLPAER